MKCWNKYRLKTTTQASDFVCGVLIELGILGMEVEDNVQLTEEEKIQMKMTRTALCFSAGRFDEAMEGCTELINLDRSEEGYYYFMFLLHHRLILQ